jgi:hypothetical protein
VLRRARERAARTLARPPAETAAPDPGEAPAAEAEAPPARAPGPPRRRARPRRRAAGAGRRPEGGRPDGGPEPRLRRALQGFNDSDAPRKVAGLTRSLGSPSVSAVPAGPPTDGGARITVAWELAWYQWEIRLTDRGFALREVAKGDEIEQLEEADRVWNARAGDDGTLRLRG